MIDEYIATLTALSLNLTTGLFETYDERVMANNPSFAELVKTCHTDHQILHDLYDVRPGFMSSYRVRVENPQGMVAMADVERRQNPLRFKLLWANEMSKTEVSEAIDYLKTRDLLIDRFTTQGEEAELFHENALKKLMLINLKKTHLAEPISQTLETIYRVEQDLGLQETKVRHLEDAMGL